jgi:hypothetical protein
MRLCASGLVVLFVSAAPAFAQTCEATFAKNGNPITGLRFSAMQTVADLSTPDAVNQLRGIVLARGYDVLAAEPAAGSMLMEQPQNANRRSFQIIAQATSEGQVATVQLRANLRAGMSVKQELVREEMCGLLAEMKGGAAGATAARQGSSATAAGSPPTVLSAQILADRLSKERDRDVNEIPLRYRGRSFTLSGNVESVSSEADVYRVRFAILAWEEKAIRLPGDSQFKTEIVCVLAPGQSVYALTLKRRSSVRLTGTFSDYRASPSPSVMWLSDCKPAQ